MLRVDKATVVGTPVDTYDLLNLVDFFERPRRFSNVGVVRRSGEQLVLGVFKNNIGLAQREHDRTDAATGLSSQTTKISPSKETVVFFVKGTGVAGICSEFVDCWSDQVITFDKRKCNF